MPTTSKGRRRTYCSNACRQRAYEKRKESKRHPLHLLARDIDTVAVRDVIRQEVRKVLQEAGLLPPLQTPPDGKQTAKRKRKAQFQIIPGGLPPTTDDD